MKINNMLRKVMIFVMAFAVALPLMTSCDPSDDPNNNNDNPGGNGGNSVSLEGTQWDCSQDLNVGAASVSFGSQLDFTSPSAGYMSVGVELMGLAERFAINYTFDGQDGTLTNTQVQKSVNFRKTDATHLTVTLTSDMLGDSLASLAPVFAMMGGSIQLNYTLHDENGGDPRDPRDPDTTGNYLSCNGVSGPISMAIMGNEEGEYLYQFTTSGQKSFVMSNPSELVSGSYNFSGEEEEGSALVGYYLDAMADDVDYVSGGSLTVVKNGDDYVVDVNATTENGKTIRLHYEGEIVDMSAPSGSGSLTFAGHTVALTMGVKATVSENGITYSEIAFADADFTNTATFVKLGDGFVAGSYTLTGEEGAYTGGTMAMIAIYDEANDEDIEGYSTAGNLTISINGSGIYTVNFGGTTENGPFTGNFTGEVNTVAVKAQLAKSRAIMKKMRRR